jgi:hypothetical protein
LLHLIKKWSLTLPVWSGAIAITFPASLALLQALRKRSKAIGFTK